MAEVRESASSADNRVPRRWYSAYRPGAERKACATVVEYEVGGAQDHGRNRAGKAFAQLGALAADCLGRHGLREVANGSDFAAVSTSATAQPCVDSARREQLAAYVAAPALPFITDPPDGPTRTVFALSPANTARIAGAAGLVLLLTVSVTVLVGTQPLWALAAAALHPTTEGQLRVPVTTHDEIGYLAAAFNDLTERRALVEEQRKAMASDVAHELRTPLSNIRSWLEAGQDGIAVPDQAFMNSLLAEALQLQHIIDDLKDLAAADAGALRLHPEPLYVRDLLDHVAGAHRARADAAGIRLDVHTEGDPALTADPIRLRQAVTNLVSNSLRHTPAGGSVTLRAASAGEAGKQAETVVIEVADTGTGIAPQDLPLVFERFWRAERSRSRQDRRQRPRAGHRPPTHGGTRRHSHRTQQPRHRVGVHPSTAHRPIEGLNHMCCTSSGCYAGAAPTAATSSQCGPRRS
ncbi:signal transduction histidine kinase [Streptomyces sp. Ag82_O1-15]|nr:signal transduction histidine kinase [Streptomyces sp. Ag82_O1-15]